MISELAITEVLSAVARKKRAGELKAEVANQIRDALLPMPVWLLRASPVGSCDPSRG